MKAQELRIGNLFIYPNCGHPLVMRVFNVSEREVNVTTEQGFGASGISFDNIQGIPITEEILLKAGFAFFAITEQGKFYALNGVTILKSHRTKKYFYDDQEILNFHELQNLYYDLKHEELEVKL